MFDIVITVNSVPEALKIKEQIFGKSSLSSLGLSLPAFNSSFPGADCHIRFILKNDPAEGYFAGEFLCV